MAKYTCNLGSSRQTQSGLHAISHYYTLLDDSEKGMGGNAMPSDVR